MRLKIVIGIPQGRRAPRLHFGVALSRITRWVIKVAAATQVHGRYFGRQSPTKNSGEVNHALKVLLTIL